MSGRGIKLVRRWAGAIERNQGDHGAENLDSSVRVTEQAPENGVELPVRVISEGVQAAASALGGQGEEDVQAVSSAQVDKTDATRVLLRSEEDVATMVTLPGWSSIYNYVWRRKSHQFLGEGGNYTVGGFEVVRNENVLGEAQFSLWVQGRAVVQRQPTFAFAQYINLISMASLAIRRKK